MIYHGWRGSGGGCASIDLVVQGAGNRCSFWITLPLGSWILGRRGRSLRGLRRGATRRDARWWGARRRRCPDFTGMAITIWLGLPLGRWSGGICCLGAGRRGMRCWGWPVRACIPMRFRWCGGWWSWSGLPWTALGAVRSGGVAGSGAADPDADLCAVGAGAASGGIAEGGGPYHGGWAAREPASRAA